MKKITISIKIALSLLLVGLLPVLIVNIIATDASRESLKEEALQRLNAVSKIKQLEIESYFEERMTDTKILAQAPSIPEAVYVLDSISKIAKSKGYKLSTDLLNYPPMKKAYDKYIHYFKQFCELYGYYDVFLISPNSGRILLSVALESDYGTELKSENTNLALAWQKAKETKTMQITDVKPYAPSNMDPAIFVVQPSYLDGNYVGSVAVQLSFKQIDAIMLQREGMGETGETYLVGSDFLMRSDSYLDKENRSLKKSLLGTVKDNGVKTEATQKAIAGERGEGFIIDYNGNEVASVYAPMDIKDLRWAIISEINSDEIYKAADELSQELLYLLLIVLIVVLIIVFVISKNISNGIKNVISELNNLISSVVQGKLDVRGDSSKVLIDFKSIIDNINDLINAFMKPLNVVAEYVDRVSKGDIPPKVTEDYRGDFNEIKNNLNQLIDTLNKVVADTHGLVEAAGNYDFSKRADASLHQGEFKTLVLGINNTLDNIVTPLEELIHDVVDMSQAASDGRLDKRIDISKHKGDFVKVAEGFNTTLNNLIAPLNVAAEYVDRISKGDMPPKINEEYRGDFNELKNNLNTCIDSIKKLVDDSHKLNEAAASGIIDYRADEMFHHGEFRAIINGVNTTLDKLSEPLNDATDFLNKVAQGEKTTEFYKPEAKGAYEIAYSGMNKLHSFLVQLNSDLKHTADKTVSGDTRARIDTKIYPGGWKEITSGINNTIEALATPMNVVLGNIDQLTKGILPDTIENNFEGDFKKLIDNMNSLITVFATMNRNLLNTIEEHSQGNIADRCDVEGMEGLYYDIMSGINEALDSIANPVIEAIGILNMYAEGDLSNVMRDLPGKQIILTNAMNKIRTNLIALVEDVKYLADSAKNGKLNVRADEAKHFGEFRNVIAGVNQTIDNIVTPLNLAANYVADISAGNIPEAITDTWNGDFNKLKESLNRCISAVDKLVDDANMLAEYAAKNELDKRADEAQHEGDFQKVIHGVNTTLDIVAEAKNEADRLSLAQAEVLESAGDILSMMSKGDLTQVMTGDYEGEHKVLQDSLNSVIYALGELISEVSDSVHQVSSASNQNLSTMESMSAASQEQSHQAEEVAAAIEEMSRTVTDNATNAAKTSEVARKNQQIAEEGGHIVKNTVSKMQDIAKVVKQSADNIIKLGESGQKIGEIISVIDDIADQTNLLALNAAIEAARAGEQGRGFAVVADEVRKLAERTTEATKEIAGMISGIQKETSNAVDAMNVGTTEVQNGIDLADKAGNALNEIVVSSKEVLDMVNAIASSNEEQSATAEEVAKNMTEISRVTADSAAQIEDIVNATQIVSELSNKLNDLVAKFRVKGSNSSASAKSFYEIDSKEIKRLR